MGFAFVGYFCRVDAEKALASVNGTSLDGRPVAVDWALSKNDYTRAKFDEVRRKEEERVAGGAGSQAAAAAEAEASEGSEEDSDGEGAEDSEEDGGEGEAGDSDAGGFGG